MSSSTPFDRARAWQEAERESRKFAASQTEILHEGGSTAPRYVVTANASEEQAKTYAASGYSVEPVPGASDRFIDAGGAISLLAYGDPAKVDRARWAKVAIDAIHAYENDLGNLRTELARARRIADEYTRLLAETSEALSALTKPQGESILASVERVVRERDEAHSDRDRLLAGIVNRDREIARLRALAVDLSEQAAMLMGDAPTSNGEG